MLSREEIRVDNGRCTGGSFLRITHVPTGISRQKAPLGGESYRQAMERFLSEIEQELVDRGLIQFIIPSYRERT